MAKSQYAKSEYWPITSLKLWDRNPRSIKADRFNELKERLKRQGQIKPLLVTKDGVVIGGNMRLRAFIELGWDEVWVSVTKAKTDKDIFDLALTDNEEFGYYEEQQVAELALELGLSSLELQSYSLSLGAPTTLDLVIDKFAPTEIDPEDDEVPEVDEVNPPVSILGDVYQLGRHRLMCGDSTSIEAVEQLMDGSKADMVFTDPPYNTGMTGESQGDSTLWRGDGKKNGSAWLSHMFDDSYTDEEWQMFMAAFMVSYDTVMKPDSAAYICLDWRRNYELIPHIKNHFHLSNVIVWDKVVHGLGSDYQYTYELINVCKKGKPVIDSHMGNDAEYQDVWHIQRKVGRDEDHATKKPLELCTRAIKHASKRGDIVADFFGGSGSTLIAAEKTDRTCYMMELDPKYCDVIRKRYAKHIGQEETWEDVTPVISEELANASR